MSRPSKTTSRRSAREPEDERPGRLPAARTRRRARGSRPRAPEVDPVDGLHCADGAPEHPGPDREVLHEPSTRRTSRIAAPRGRASRRSCRGLRRDQGSPPAPTGYRIWSAGRASPPGSGTPTVPGAATARSSGSSSRHTARPCEGQRGWNAHPRPVEHDGGWPGIGCSQSSSTVSRGRRPAARPCRDAAAPEDRLDAAGLDDPAGVHDHHAVAHLGDHPEVVGDQDWPRASPPGCAPARRGPGPGRSRRARSSARRR